MFCYAVPLDGINKPRHELGHGHGESKRFAWGLGVFPNPCFKVNKLLAPDPPPPPLVGPPLFPPARSFPLYIIQRPISLSAPSFNLRLAHHRHLHRDTDSTTTLFTFASDIDIVSHSNDRTRRRPKPTESNIKTTPSTQLVIISRSKE